jgi:hypothetical protein
VSQLRRHRRSDHEARFVHDQSGFAMIGRSRSPGWRTAVLAPLLVVLLGLVADVTLASPRTITRSQATAVATAISLRHSDLPGLKQEANPITAQQRRLTAQATACAGGVPASEAFANTQSPAFVSSGQSSVTVVSGTEILPSAVLVAKDFAAVTRPHALTCLLSELTSSLRASLPKGDKVTSATAARIPSVVSGIADAFAIRITFAVSVREATTTVSVPLYADQIGFSDGQAEVDLEVQTTVIKPSASLERQLAGLLVARARSAIG